MFTLELRGWWWTPDKSESPVPGTLIFTEARALNLSLMGSLSDEGYPMEGIGLGQPLPLVLGIVSGQEVTLVEAVPHRRHFSVPGFNNVEYRVGIAYLGQHYDSVADISFSKIGLRFTHLEDWMAEVKTYTRLPEPGSSLRRHEVGFEQEKPTPQPIKDGTVTLGYDAKVKEDALSAAIQVSACMRIELGKKLDVNEWYRGYIQPIENLLSLAAGTSVLTRELVAYSPEERARPPIQVVGAGFVAERERSSLLTRDTMLFTAKDLECSFGEMLTRWLVFEDEYRDVLNLYFSIARSPRMYLEHQFLSVVQALEGYHRRRFPGTELPADKHAQRLEAILGAVPEKYRDWLEKELRFSNELNLASRLKAMIGIAGDVFTPWTPNSRKKASFVRKVVDARNYLTHYASGQPPRPLDTGKRFDLTEALSILMQTLLLAELGFTPERRADLFRRNQRYGWTTTRTKSTH